MASDQTLRAVLPGLDRTAAPLHAINQRFADPRFEALIATARSVGGVLDAARGRIDAALGAGMRLAMVLPPIGGPVDSEADQPSDPFRRPSRPAA